MQSQHLNIQMGQLLDQTSNTKIKVENGHFIVQNLETGSVQRYLLPPLKFKDQKIAFGLPLKFVSKSSNVQLNPTGNIFICKSLTFQQVEMSKTYNKEIAYWSLYLPQRCSSFSVGIKSIDLKKSYTFDFSISKPTTLTFKLDLEEKVFTCWLNGVRSEWHKPISIENESQWSPFVRVKNIGTQLILNSLVTDPQTPFVSYLNSNKQNTLSEFAQPEIHSQQEGIQRNEENYHLQKMTNNKIILIGQNHIKLISRKEDYKQFDLSFAQFTKDNKVSVPLSQREFQTINKFSKKSHSYLLRLKLTKSDSNGYLMTAAIPQWRQELTQILRTLNSIKEAVYQCSKGVQGYNFKEISIQEVDDVAKIFLSKVQMVNPYLNVSQKINSLYSEFNVKFNNTEPLPFFDQVKTSFNVPRSIAENNYPFVKFNSQIISVKTAAENFIACLLKDGNRISIVNTQSIPFKLIDTIISRGFIKETQINQYKKQVQDINDSDFTKPHIFKILKNCLKYADKIKPPEKLLKQLQKKKQQIEVKKSTIKEQKPIASKIQADRELLTSLISMGFNEKLSTKVLIQCKNQSIEAALQLILSKYPHENQQTTFKGQTKNKPKRQWQCQMCTLINSKDSVSCSACDTPAPAQSALDEIQMLESKVQQAEIKQQEGEKEISSPSIDNQSIKDIFIWNTKVAYCPLLIAAIFQTKIRFRLLGPNPKFYSNFYVKDNGYFDLTTLKYHEFAHQINQSQINDMFFLGSSTQEQRKLHWGWMNIEDWDYDISNNKNITSIDFKSIKITNKQHKFLIHVNSQKVFNTLNCQILFDNVYEEKKRCFVIKDINVTQGERKPQDVNETVLEKKEKYVDENRMIVSLRSSVVCEIVKEVSCNQEKSAIQSTLPQDHTSKNSTPNATKSDLIPLIAISGPYSSTLSYPSCQLQSYSFQAFNRINQQKNGLTFKHIQNKKFTVKSVKIERQNSTFGIQKVGYFYLINDLSKQPLIKHDFSFYCSSSKTIINIPNQQEGSYLVIILNPNHHEQYRQIITSVSVYGQVLSTSTSNTLSHQAIDVTELVRGNVKISFANEQIKDKQWKQLVNIKCELINYPYDLFCLNEKQLSVLLQNLIHKNNIPINLRLTIEPKTQEHSQLIISSVELQNFTILKSFTQFTKKHIQLLTQQQYKNCLLSFFTTTDGGQFDIICKQENKKEYKKVIEQINLQQFVHKIIRSQYKGKQFIMLKQFINIFACELAKNKTLTNEKVIKNAIRSQQLTPAGAEILFQLIKLVKAASFSMLQNELYHHLCSISQKRLKQSSSSYANSSKHPSQSYHKQQSMFSPLLHKLAKPTSSTSILEQQSTPMYHFTCQKHPHGRKYTIDMMSLYKVEEIELRLVDGVRDKERVVIEVAYVNELGEEIIMEKRFIDEFVWSQLLMGSSSGKVVRQGSSSHSSIFLNYTINPIPSRYIIINLTFTTIPTHTIIKQYTSSSSSTLELIPIIRGSYLGQSQPILQQHFQITNQLSSVHDNTLQMIKKVDNFVKYGNKNDQKLFYYTSCQDNFVGNNNDDNINTINKTLTQLRKRQQTQQNKQSIVKILLKSPSQHNLNYNFTMGYLIINALIDTLERQNVNDIKFDDKNLVQLLIEHFVNYQRGQLMQKAVLLLRKIILLNNSNVLEKVLLSKISTQSVFNHLFKQLRVNQNQNALEVMKQLINVEKFVNNKYLALNISWLAKLYTLDSNMIKTLVKTQYQSGYLQQSSIIFVKYGWTQCTVDILNSLITKNKKQRLPIIISSSKSKKQLSQFAFEQLKSSNQQIFTLILSQLAQKSRHTHIKDIQNIVFYMIENIKMSQEDDCEKRQQFLNVLAIINKFGYTNEIAQQVIRIFFKLEEKNAYLNELLNCTFMKQKHLIEILLSVTFTQVNTKSLKRDDLTLLNDILGFVLAKQVNLESQKISFTLQNNTQKIVLKFFSNYLHNALTIGGLESAKMTDQLLTQKIKIAFYLSTLLQSNQGFKQIDQQIFTNLIKWLLVNITTNDQKHPKTPNCNRFLKIEQTVWKIIQQKGKIEYQLFSKLYVQLYKKMKQQIMMILNDTLRYQYLRKLHVFNIRVFEKFSNQRELLQVLNLNNGFFEEVLQEFVKIDAKNMQLLSESCYDQQLVNELTLHPDPKLKPSDWLIYKNGSKNHIYKIQYFKNTQQLIELTFMHDQQFTLSKIIFAFKLESGSEKNICLPKSITVQGGVSLDKLRYLGEMFEVKDDRYYNLSTKLYGLNMNILREKVTIEKQLNKNLPIKYLRFKIRAPQPISIEDVLEGAEIMELQNKVSLVNFLSIQGQKTKYAQQSINELVKLLELLTLPQHRMLINKLFNISSVTQKFKLSLLTFSQLMKHQKYNKTIHNFLMRVCQQNTIIGNEMLTKYLDIKNSQICAKIATQIVLANDDQLKDRVILMYEFLQRVINENRAKIDENILPFMNRFAQVAYYTMTRQNYTTKETLIDIPIQISQQTIEKLLLQLEQNTESSQTIVKFFSTILTLSKPFTVSGFVLNDVLIKIVQRKNVHFDQLLSALVINSDKCRKWLMSNEMLEIMFDQMFELIKNTKDISKIVSNMTLLTTLSLNPSIKQLINKYQYNLKLFELLMSKNTQTILSAPQNEQLRKSFVDLITRTSLGSENQAIIGQLLKDSIPSIISQGNEKFVGEIFLPLLNSFEKVPICVLPYVESENKLITDFSNIDFRTDKNQQTKFKQNQQDISGFRLPSSLVSQEVKQKIFDQLIKNSYINGKFNLALNHGNYTQGLGQPIINNIFFSNRPFMMIIKAKLIKDPSQTRTICIFYNRTKQNQKKLKLNWTKGSFIMFIDHLSKVNNTTQNIVTISKQPQKNQTFLDYRHFELNTNQNYDQQGDEYQSIVFQYDDKSFGQIGYGGSYFNVMHFDQINVFADNGGYQAWQPQSVEYWLLYSSLQSANQKAIQVKQKSTLPQLTKSLLQTNYDHTLFSSIHKASTTLNTLRYETVYEFPASLTIRQLKQSMRIINCSIDEKKLKDLKLTIKGNQLSSIITDDMTLEDIRKLSKTKDTIVLDLNVHVDNLLDVLNLKSPFKRQQVDFLPKKGILKYFEENQGIQAMIKVIKKSIQGWKNKTKMEKWLQYVTQLQNFSHFPHFFAIYLKDKQTFNLLFNLLAGLPDKETDPKWDVLEASSSQKLLKIVSQILHMDKTSQFRQYALKNNFFITILQRLRILTGLFKRKYDKDFKQEQEEDNKSPNKAQIEDDGTKKIKKKKGVGYGNDSSSNTKWMKGDNMQERKKQFETVKTILEIIENFLDVQSTWRIPDLLLENIYESALLPFVEDGLRAGTLLQISKHPQKFKAIFNIIRVLSRHEQLIPVLLPIDQRYQPKQIQSIESLLKSLENIASIFLSCLNQSKTTQTAQQKMSAQLATLIKETYKSVEQAIEQYKENHMNDDTQQKHLQEILQLSLDKKYRLLMKDLRFDYIDMKQTPNKIKHHYSSSFNPNYTPNQNKMIRLAQELADISTALPHQHTNAVYVRCDKDRVDFMQALIMGSNGTPYGHGAFLFDVYFDDNYPNNPPKVNLTTTGHGKVRFNPNLYACGKVCLSLLGTWRGSASENWDAKVSTLLQVLLSIQAIIMSEQIYFNEPGFENQQGTQEGEKKNQAYSNIVRYCNIKFAMIENIRNPPKGFETVIRRHFYLKKDEIMQECRKWQKYAQKRPANYIGLVNDHNHSWSNEFKKSKTQYKQMLDQAIKQLQEQLNKLPAPKITDIITTKQSKKQTKKKVTTNKIQQLQKQQLQQIDVSYDKSLMSTESKQIDITDEKVKDRWSRYIGAMGIDAVSKQSKADILVFGLNPLALEVVKNLVLSGCRRLTICDDKLVSKQDLAGGFFYTMEDVGKKRVESILYKIRQLNVYVKIDTIPSFEHLTPTTLKTYSLILATQLPLTQQIKISTICRQQKIKFISADCIGFTGRIINDLGEKFEVLDKNGQQPVEVFIKEITNAQKGIVTLLDGVKNPFEDGQAILIRNVQGMKIKQGQKEKSINETIHKVRVINSKSFEIGSTLNYTPYVRNGTAKNIKTPVEITYKPFAQIVLDHKNISVDENLAFYDFAKLQNSKLVKSCYLTLEEFRKKNEMRYPEPWNMKDMTVFVDIFKTVYGEDVDEKLIKFVEKFALTSRGYLPPLCAFFGGLVCQQIIKAITQKYKPINSEFYIEFSQIVPELPQQFNENSLKEIFSFNKNSRDIGLEMVVGSQLVQVIRNSKLFMIGSGAIGCELLKNFAMIGFGTGEKGKITLTDPDHIENSNLNRQFLFREKHISKSKSRTASEAVKLMNPALKNHITALTERVSDSTKDIFTNKFFEGLTLVANALDNVAARRYVDQRCVQNKIPLFQSGTLGPKGHVQVIIPYLTESYGSQNDPVQEGEIPHCTLKMFPQETLHCVQWARDIFGKKFSLQPKALIKIIDKTYKPQKDDIKSLNQCVTMVKKGPKTFEDCINYAIHKFYKYYRDDVMQLLYTYPLDAKTKNGQPFWKLPKRPPTPIMQFDPENILQCTFVTSLAVMVAKIYQVEYPKNFRSQSERLFIGKQASKVKIPEFVPSDEKAKEILKQSTEKKEQNAQEQKMQEVIQEKDENELYKEIITTGGHQFKIKTEQFEKDDDSNGHIDFIYSMANLRAINYKLDQMDWINVKIKAGRIVPALATTTACVSGLQTLEICKYLKKIKIDLMKNSYLNLAVPSIQMSQPGEVQKKKITEKLTVNLWDRWQVVCQKSSTFGDLYEKLFKKYEIFPMGVLQGMSRIDTGKSQQAKKQFMKQKILDKLDLEDNYIDIIVLFTKNQQDDKIIEGVPPVRLIFN